MKAKFILLVLLVTFLLSAGCIDESGPSNSGEANDNVNGADNNDNTSNDDQTIIAGWYLNEIVDYNETDSSSSLYGIMYSRGNTTANRTSPDGQYKLSVRTTWNAPPEFIAEEDEISVQVTKEALVLQLLLLGYQDSTSVLLDDYTIIPGFGTASKYFFIDEIYGTALSVGQGDTPDTIKTAIFTGFAPKSDGPYGEQFGLMVTISNGLSYGTKYIYEWRE